MDRQGDRIHFNEEEQSKFGVAANVSIDSARSTAAAFNTTAEGLDSQAKTLNDRSNPSVIARSAGLAFRATELATFASGIIKQCTPEIDADFLKQLGA